MLDKNPSAKYIKETENVKIMLFFQIHVSILFESANLFFFL